MQRMLVTIGALAAVAAAGRVGAQAAAASPAAPPVPPPAERQVAGAVTPLPEPLRAGATVLGYGPEGGRLTSLRRGANDFICLADDPAQPGFHASCYHKGLEPFMARGRELREQGKARAAVDSIRQSELRAGRYAIPQNAALYQLFADAADYDPATGAVKNPRALYVIYTPNATPESTGLVAQPVRGGPWIMYPGTPVAHIMIVPVVPETPRPAGGNP
ncbi:MAG TPA: hypothetical protein VKA84_22045 [Gemmatimonadaceae bacterium]|nr:hypothetical protein [Gemmatimonadaceae bacterium]